MSVANDIFLSIGGVVSAQYFIRDRCMLGKGVQFHLFTREGGYPTYLILLPPARGKGEKKVKKKTSCAVGPEAGCPSVRFPSGGGGGATTVVSDSTCANPACPCRSREDPVDSVKMLGCDKGCNDLWVCSGCKEWMLDHEAGHVHGEEGEVPETIEAC